MTDTSGRFADTYYDIILSYNSRAAIAQVEVRSISAQLIGDAYYASRWEMPPTPSVLPTNLLKQVDRWERYQREWDYPFLTMYCLEPDIEIAIAMLIDEARNLIDEKIALYQALADQVKPGQVAPVTPEGHEPAALLRRWIEIRDRYATTPQGIVGLKVTRPLTLAPINPLNEKP